MTHRLRSAAVLGAGVMGAQMVAEGATVNVGAVIGVIEAASGAAAPVAAAAPAATAPSVEAEASADLTLSPAVRRLVLERGLDPSKIKGTGQDGRVSKKDLIDYLEKRKSGIKVNPDIQHPSSFTQSNEPTAENKNQQPASSAEINEDFTSGGNSEIIEMDRMRKMISEHMTRSIATSAHVTSFAEADVTNLVKWREKIKGAFEKREGEKITYTPIFIEAITKSIKEFPLLNSSLSGDKIILKKDINIGMATALPNGNLIVPVIKNADQLSMLGLVRQVNRLADKARSGKLQPADTQHGTFTFTNIGTFGSLMGTPIINQPQVAILAVGAIKKKPVVIESEKGDSIAIRHMMFVSMSYDHRIIDGGLGSKFLAAFVKALESFDINSSY